MDFSIYENTLPYPSITDATTIYYYKAGKTVAIKVGEETQYMNGVVHLTPCIKEKVTDKESFRKMRDAYDEENKRLYERFIEDVKEDLGITNNPKADKLMSKAWERGHSGGYADVYSCAVDLVELIED